jgi:hypothetical protein
VDEGLAGYRVPERELYMCAEESDQERERGYWGCRGMMAEGRKYPYIPGWRCKGTCV